MMRNTYRCENVMIIWFILLYVLSRLHSFTLKTISLHISNNILYESQSPSILSQFIISMLNSLNSTKAKHKSICYMKLNDFTRSNYFKPLSTTRFSFRTNSVIEERLISFSESKYFYKGTMRELLYLTHYRKYLSLLWFPDLTIPWSVTLPLLE